MADGGIRESAARRIEELINQESSGENDISLYARTFTGKAIEGIYQAATGTKQLTEKEQIELGKKCDQYAEITADTVSMVPVFKAKSAGLIRACLLSGEKDNFGTFAKNALEGAALNKIGRLSAPESSLSRCLEAQVGRGVQLQATRHFVIGAGFGTVKASFNEHTWKDQYGEIDPVTGLSRVAGTAFLAGAVSVPAGLLSDGLISKIAPHGLESTAARPMRTLGAGVISGSFSGSLSGGLDAYLAGGTAGEVGTACKEGLVVGGLTGLGMFGFLSGKPSVAGLRFPNESHLRHETVLGAPKANITAKKSTPFHLIEETVDYIPSARELASLTFQGQPLSLPEKLARLNGYESKVVDLPFLKSETSKSLKPELKPSTLLSEYYDQAVDFKETPVRSYRIDNVEVLVPESYAGELDQVLRWRETIETNRGPESRNRVAEARKELSSSPYMADMHPIDFAGLLEQLPDRNLIRRVILRSQASPVDPWHRQIHGEDFQAAATASPDGTITFYRARRHKPVEENLRHEWAHLLDFEDTHGSSLFDSAARAEQDGYYVSEYATHNLEENYAEHMAQFLHPDAREFLTLVTQAPLRSIGLSRTLNTSLEAVQKSLQSTQQRVISDRIAFVHKNILPQAQKIAEQQMWLAEHGVVNSPDTNQQRTREAAAAAEVIGFIGDDEHLHSLRVLAKESQNEAVRNSGLAALIARTMRRGQVSAGYDVLPAPADSLSAKARQADVAELMADLGQNGSRSRQAILNFLENESNPHFSVVRKLLQLDPGRSDSHILALGLMNETNLPALKELGWQKAQAASSGSREKQMLVALHALKYEVAYQRPALEMLAGMGDPLLTDTFRSYRYSSDPQITRLAGLGLEQIKSRQLMLRTDIGIQTSSLARQSQILQESQALLRSPEQSHYAVPPLLKLYLHGEAGIRVSAGRNLRNLCQETVLKQYVRQMGLEEPQRKPDLEALLQ